MLNKLDLMVQGIVYRLDSIFKLLFRIIIGSVFIESGWGKFHDMQHTVEFFQSIHIPAPYIQAPMIAGIELTCGCLVLAGLLTRLSCIPLLGTMIVAMLTAHRADLTSLSALTELPPFLYATIMIAILMVGPGVISLDQWIFKRK